MSKTVIPEDIAALVRKAIYVGPGINLEGENELLDYPQTKVQLYIVHMVRSSRTLEAL